MALEHSLGLELARATEASAIAAARFRGRGSERLADQAAARAMVDELNALSIDGTIVVGERASNGGSPLALGGRVGKGDGPVLDIAADALEGATVCAKNLPNSISILAAAPPGGLLKTPPAYMDKIAIGPGYPAGVVSLDRSPSENVEALAAAKGVSIEEITICILDRPRHGRIIDEVRAAGAAIQLIGDGDVAGVIHAANPAETGIDMYLGIGGAQEGVLAAAALRCLGGYMEGRLQLTTPDKRKQAEAYGVTEPDRIYGLEELAGGEVVFTATGVTSGDLLEGIRSERGRVRAHTLIMHSTARTIREMRTHHLSSGC